MSQLILKDKYTIEELYKAYQDCSKRKKYTKQALEFKPFEMDYLYLLLDEINSGVYKPLSSNVFVITNPKPREVWAGQFKDRIVQHLLYNNIGKYYEDRFIEDTFSCINKRGISGAVNRLKHFCKSISNNWNSAAFALKMDISNYFVSINKDILWNILETKIGNSSLTSNLLKVVLFNDPTKNPNKKGNKFDSVPPQKSLFNSRPNCGLPIGNLLSQFLSNVYLDSMDKYAKHLLRCKYYIRYVDDIIILDKNIDKIYELLDLYNEELLKTKELTIQPSKTKVQPINSGIDCLGTIVLPYRDYIRNRTIHNFINSAENFITHPFDESVKNSYKSLDGFISHHNTYNLRKKYKEKIYGKLK